MRLEMFRDRIRTFYSDRHEVVVSLSEPFMWEGRFVIRTHNIESMAEALDMCDELDPSEYEALIGRHF